MNGSRAERGGDEDPAQRRDDDGRGEGGAATRTPASLTGELQHAVPIRPRGRRRKSIADVATVVLRFADGTHVKVAPTDGFVLYTVPRGHLVRGRQVVVAGALSAAGATIGTKSFVPPPRR